MSYYILLVFRSDGNIFSTAPCVFATKLHVIVRYFFLARQGELLLVKHLILAYYTSLQEQLL